jgi:two-component system chemotaxis response regulator CheY
MKILIVDDDEFSRVLLLDMLRDVGQCDMAINGYDAIDVFMRSRADGVPYDLICLDVIMPGIDGLQVLKQIRALEARDSISEAESVKVIMISSMSDLEHIMMAFNPACEAYMIKPFERSLLYEHLAMFGFQV